MTDTLTPADVDLMRAALRIAIRDRRNVLRSDRKFMAEATVAQSQARIRAMEQLADRLKPHAPPELPEAECIRCDPGALQPCGPDCPILPE